MTGFISIDCGKGYTYNDRTTGLTYTSDSSYVATGEVHRVASEYQNHYRYSHANSLRSFPSGKRNCYTLKPVDQGRLYLVRAYFLYGNYDGLNRIPRFDIHLDVNFWTTLKLGNASQYHFSEILAVAPTNIMSLCLVNTGSGTPFVSAIDVRPLVDTMYPDANASQSLVMAHRLNFGVDTNNYRLR